MPDKTDKQLNKEGTQVNTSDGGTEGDSSEVDESVSDLVADAQAEAAEATKSETENVMATAKGGAGREVNKVRADALKQSEIKIATEHEAPRNDESNEPSDALQSDESPTQDEVVEPVTEALVVDDRPGKWYVVHTYSGHENKVAAALRQRIEAEHLENSIIDILVPTQNKIEIKSGRKTEVKEKIFPGYILVKMVLDDTSWLAVRTIPGVTSFVGMGNKPTVISDKEVATIIKYSQIEQPTFKQVFSADDTVRIADGPFAEMIGKVDSVDAEGGKVRVLVSIFGRETPVELDFLQVQKI